MIPKMKATSFLSRVKKFSGRKGNAMQLRSAVWAFAGVAVIALAGYSLNRGLHVGSTIEAARLSDQYPVPFYKKHCRYFVLERRAAGLDKLQTHPGRSREEPLCAAEKRAGIRSQTAQGLNTSELAISRRPRAGLRASIIASLRLDVVLAHDLAPCAHLPGEDRREIPGRRRAVETSAASRHGRLDLGGPRLGRQVETLRTTSRSSIRGRLLEENDACVERCSGACSVSTVPEIETPRGEL
jgi:hypothetical protein